MRAPHQYHHTARWPRHTPTVPSSSRHLFRVFSRSCVCQRVLQVLNSKAHACGRNGVHSNREAYKLRWYDLDRHLNNELVRRGVARQWPSRVRLYICITFYSMRWAPRSPSHVCTDLAPRKSDRGRPSVSHVDTCALCAMDTVFSKYTRIFRSFWTHA